MLNIRNDRIYEREPIAKPTIYNLHVNEVEIIYDR